MNTCSDQPQCYSVGFFSLLQLSQCEIKYRAFTGQFWSPIGAYPALQKGKILTDKRANRTEQSQSVISVVQGPSTFSGDSKYRMICKFIFTST